MQAGECLCCSLPHLVVQQEHEAHLPGHGGSGSNLAKSH